ncbi:hypothetical protein ABVT39_017104 [Epinephelus coioides]
MDLVLASQGGFVTLCTDCCTYIPDITDNMTHVVAHLNDLLHLEKSRDTEFGAARVEDLEEFIDHYYYECVMEGPADNPNKRKKTDSATDTQDLLSSEFSVLESINKKLEVLGMLHQEIKDLKVSLEFTYQQISDLQQNNAELRSTLAAVCEYLKAQALLVVVHACIYSNALLHNPAMLHHDTSVDCNTYT